MSALRLYDSTNTFYVDFTKTASITRQGTNPLIVIPIPTGKDAAELGGAIAIDLKMLSDRIDIKFTLETGVGSHTVTVLPSGMVSTTDYEKLWYMFKYDIDYKHLLWEGYTFHVVIDGLTTPTDAGNFKLMQNCSISMTVVNPLSP